jgi:hypothetical protein
MGRRLGNPVRGRRLGCVDDLFTCVMLSTFDVLERAAEEQLLRDFPLSESVNATHVMLAWAYSSEIGMLGEPSQMTSDN